MRRYWQLTVTALWALYALLMAYFVIRPLLGLPFVPILLILSTLILFGFSVGHAVWSLGGRQALLFLGLAFAVSLLFESVGVLTGWVYGPYHYTDRLGVKVFGLVPLLIPIAWFMMIYPSHVLVERLAAGHRGSGLSRTVWLASLSALAMTAWDLVMDPIMVAGDHWVWEVEGAYFGIPVRNYAGWLVTTFCIYLLYRLIVGRRAPQPWGNSSQRFRNLPLWAYAVTWLGNVAIALEMGWAGPAVAGFFGMGTFALLGLGTVLWGSLEKERCSTSPESAQALSLQPERGDGH